MAMIITATAPVATSAAMILFQDADEDEALSERVQENSWVADIGYLLRTPVDNNPLLYYMEAEDLLSNFMDGSWNGAETRWNPEGTITVSADFRGLKYHAGVEYFSSEPISSKNAAEDGLPVVTLRGKTYSWSVYKTVCTYDIRIGAYRTSLYCTLSIQYYVDLPNGELRHECVFDPGMGRVRLGDKDGMLVFLNDSLIFYSEGEMVYFWSALPATRYTYRYGITCDGVPYIVSYKGCLIVLELGIDQYSIIRDDIVGIMEAGVNSKVIYALDNENTLYAWDTSKEMEFEEVTSNVRSCELVYYDQYRIELLDGTTLKYDFVQEAWVPEILP